MLFTIIVLFGKAPNRLNAETVNLLIYNHAKLFKNDFYGFNVK